MYIRNTPEVKKDKIFISVVYEKKKKTKKKNKKKKKHTHKKKQQKTKSNSWIKQFIGDVQECGNYTTVDISIEVVVFEICVLLNSLDHNGDRTLV